MKLLTNNVVTILKDSISMDLKECSEKVIEGPYCLKHAAPILNFISSKWSVHVITLIAQAQKPVRFNEIEKKLKKAAGSLSPKTLTARLREAESLKLINREIFPEIPPHVEYRLTSEGETFFQAMLPLLDWASNCVNHDCETD